MTKFTNDQKLDAVKRYQNSHESIEEIAKSMGTYSSVVSNWINQFDYHGVSAFEKSYTSYTTQFKMDVLNYMQENGVSSNEAAVIFKISSPGMIRNWRTQLEKGGLDALFSKKKGRPSMKSLIALTAFSLMIVEPQGQILKVISNKENAHTSIFSQYSLLHAFSVQKSLIAQEFLISPARLLSLSEKLR